MARFLLARFLLLTQDDCPRCERLEKMLERPLKGAFDASIEAVHRQTHPERFTDLAQRYKVASTPVLIDVQSGDVLRHVESLTRVKAFLEA